jgi:hypothetical protein
MRLPGGQVSVILKDFVGDGHYSLLGCLSSEDRCTAIPLALLNDRCERPLLLKVLDPPDAFPDYSTETKARIAQNELRLQTAGVAFESQKMDLLATEDELLDILGYFDSSMETTTLILDITSFPKRYFCFFVKRLMQSTRWRNVIVTYTGAGGYPSGHLAEDPMTSDYLPGFAASLEHRKTGLVIAAGFESLGIRSIVEHHLQKTQDMRILLSYPPDGDFIRRQWQTVQQIVGKASRFNINNMRIISTWDAEEVYLTLASWHDEAGDLVLAPFGAKPHTLGMALFATHQDCALVYTQPKSYNPAYALGQAATWSYVVKWDGIPCYDRRTYVP